MAKVIRSGTTPSACSTPNHLPDRLKPLITSSAMNTMPAVAEFPHAGQVAGRGNHDAGGAGDRLEHDRGDRARPLQQDRLLEMFERPMRLLGLGAGVELAAVQERAEEAHDAAVGVVVGPAAGRRSC